jgi:hypothetical protein
LLQQYEALYPGHAKFSAGSACSGLCRGLRLWGGAEKRKKHGSKGALVFRDPNQSDRVWVVFDWDQQGWQRFVSDPDVPPVMTRRRGTRRSRRR